jgi:hypothetical protein
MATISTLMPPGIVTCPVGANYGKEVYYMLLKDGKLMFLHMEQAYERCPPTNFAQISRDTGLRRIQAALENLPFGRSLWVDLRVRHGNEIHFHRARSPLYKDVCDPYEEWKLIDEKEIIFTKFLSMEEWAGLWGENEVDLQMAWDEVSAIRIRGISQGFRIMQGLDLTFGVIGHVARDGKIMGVMTERARGRPVQVRDRALVEQAFATLRKRCIRFDFPEPKWSILITEDDKVRFLDPYNVKLCSRGDEASNREYYQRLLDDLFKSLKLKGNALISYREATPRIHYLTKTSPDRPLPVKYFLTIILDSNLFGDEQSHQYARNRERNFLELVSRDKNVQKNHHFLGCCRRLLLGPEEVSDVVLDSVSDDEDWPFNPTIQLPLYPSLPDWSDNDRQYIPPRESRGRSRSPRRRM